MKFNDVGKRLKEKLHTWLPLDLRLKMKSPKIANLWENQREQILRNSNKLTLKLIKDLHKDRNIWIVLHQECSRVSKSIQPKKPWPRKERESETMNKGWPNKMMREIVWPMMLVTESNGVTWKGKKTWNYICVYFIYYSHNFLMYV